MNKKNIFFIGILGLLLPYATYGGLPKIKIPNPKVFTGAEIKAIKKLLPKKILKILPTEPLFHKSFQSLSTSFSHAALAPEYVLQNLHNPRALISGTLEDSLKRLAVHRAYIEREATLIGTEMVNAMPLKNIIEAGPEFSLYSKMLISKRMPTGAILKNDTSGMLFVVTDDFRVVNTKDGIMDLMLKQKVSPFYAEKYYFDFRNTQNQYSEISRALRENERAVNDLPEILKIQKSSPVMNLSAARELYDKIQTIFK